MHRSFTLLFHYLQDNPTLQNKKKSEELFPIESRVRQIRLIVEAKGDTLITV